MKEKIPSSMDDGGGGSTRQKNKAEIGLFHTPSLQAGAEEAVLVSPAE